MSQSYRFVRLDPELQPVEQVELICGSDEDALLLAERVGRRVEVWRDGARLGLVGSGVAEALAAAPPRIVPDAPADAAVAPTIVPEAAPEPVAPTPAPSPVPVPVASDDTPSAPRAFNPFRPSVWRKRGPEG